MLRFHLFRCVYKLSIQQKFICTHTVRMFYADEDIFITCTVQIPYSIPKLGYQKGFGADAGTEGDIHLECVTWTAAAHVGDLSQDSRGAFGIAAHTLGQESSGINGWSVPLMKVLEHTCRHTHTNTAVITNTYIFTSARRECLWTFSPLWTVGASCCKTPRLLVNARVRRANLPQP